MASSRESFELSIELPGALGLLQTSNPLVSRREGDAMTPAGGLHSQGDRQMRLAGARRSEEHHVLGLEEEVELREVGDQRS